MGTRKKTKNTDARIVEKSTSFNADASRADRALAIAAGNYRVSVTREVNRLLAENSRRPFAVAKEGLKRLAVDGFISAEERRQLDEVCSLVVASGGKGRNAAIVKIRAIYQRMVIESGASPVALAIASIAASMEISIQQPAPGAAASGPTRTDLRMVGGAIAGAGIGGLIGGASGAVSGAVIGGIVGNVAGACSE